MTMPRFKTNFVNFLILFFIIIVGGVVLQPTQVAAVGVAINEFPNPADFGRGGNVFVEVAKSGNGSGLNTPLVTMVIEFTQQNGNLIFFDEGLPCSGSPDSGTAPTNFYVYAAETSTVGGYAVDRPSGSPQTTTVPFGTAGCSGNRTVITGTPALKESTVPGRAEKWIAIVVVAHMGPNNGGGLNAFKVRTSDPNAKIGLRGDFDGGSAISLQDRLSQPRGISAPQPDAADYFRLGFSLPCDYESATVPIRWYDADWGTIQGNDTFEMRVIEYLNGNVRVAAEVKGADLGGNGAERSVPIDVVRNATYEIQWNYVHRSNGIQIYVPFDSTNTGLQCEPPPVSCKVGSRVAALGPRQYVSNLSIDTGNLVEFYSDLTTDGTTTTNIAWNFGGAAANRSFAVPPTNIFDAATENVTFNTSGNFIVRVTISYTGGGTSGTYTCSMNVNVAAPPILNWEIVFTGTSADGTPDRVQPGQFWRISYSKLRNNGAGGSYGGGGPTDGQVNIVYTFTGAWGSTPIPNISGLNIDAGSEYAVTTPVDIRIPNVGAGERLCVRQTIQNPTGITGDGPDSGPNLEGAEVCTVVVKRPYLQAFGADVMAGCNAGGGTINAYRKYSYPSFGVQNDAGSGSGAQFGVLAQSSISGFVSSLFGGGKKKLTFANNSTEEYGGKFGANTCTGDYFADEPAATAVGGINYVVPNGESIKKSGNVRINSGVLTNGTHAELYVTGNAYIGSNIKFSETWNSFKDIPSFKLVVDGDIYIGKNVSQIDGFYIATGTIYTCAESLNNAVLDTNIYARCNRQLTINGSFIANKVKFMRSYGWTKNANNNGSRAAEVFRYNPSLYMVDWDAPSASQSAQTYDSVFTLPPIL